MTIQDTLMAETESFFEERKSLQAKFRQKIFRTVKEAFADYDQVEVRMDSQYLKAFVDIGDDMQGIYLSWNILGDSKDYRKGINYFCGSIIEKVDRPIRRGV